MPTLGIKGKKISPEETYLETINPAPATPAGEPLGEIEVEVSAEMAERLQKKETVIIASPQETEAKEVAQPVRETLAEVADGTISSGKQNDECPETGFDLTPPQEQDPEVTEVLENTCEAKTPEIAVTDEKTCEIETEETTPPNALATEVSTTEASLLVNKLINKEQAVETVVVCQDVHTLGTPKTQSKNETGAIIEVVTEETTTPNQQDTEALVTSLESTSIPTNLLDTTLQKENLAHSLFPPKSSYHPDYTLAILIQSTVVTFPKPNPKKARPPSANNPPPSPSQEQLLKHDTPTTEPREPIENAAAVELLEKIKIKETTQIAINSSTPEKKPKLAAISPNPSENEKQVITSSLVDETPPSLFRSRSFAALIDISIACSFFVLGLLFFPEPPRILPFVFGGLYLLTKDSLGLLNGQSLGKKLLKLRVVNHQKRTLAGDYLTGLKRNLSWLAAPIEFAILYVREDEITIGKRLGDDWAKTEVIREEKPAPRKSKWLP